jgi:hypothetical protein
MNQRYFLSVLTSLLVLVSLLVVTGAPLRAESLTKAERERLVNHLQKTRQFLLDEVADLSEAQATFKEADDRWSVRDCVEHLALSEDLFRGLILGQIMTSEPVTERKADTERAEEKVLKLVVNRTQKFQAPDPVQPTGRWGTLEEAVQAFLKRRAKTLKYVRSTQEDLRSHVMQNPAVGEMDAYQWWLFTSGHTERHTLQIQEVKAHSDFPKE